MDTTNTYEGHAERVQEIAAETAKPYRGRNRMHPNQRAEQIHRLLVAEYDCCANDPTTALGDLMSDILHFAHAYGVDLDEAMPNSRFHFTAELEEEAEDEEAELEEAFLLEATKDEEGQA